MPLAATRERPRLNADLMDGHHCIERASQLAVPAFRPLQGSGRCLGLTSARMLQ